jgi:hypothetical protein
LHKVTRVAYNSSNWQRPTGEARQYEAKGTYNHKNGFGHEEWLFRSEWLIDGWRYAFIQGVNKSHSKLVKTGQTTNITLYTIEPDKKRRFVATILDVECLNDQQAKEALEVFKERGWYDTMLNEIESVQGTKSALGAVEWATHVLNVRFRQENIRVFLPNVFAELGNPILKSSRYQLSDYYEPVPAIKKPITGGGSTNLPNTNPFMRQGSGTVECTPEHARMQIKLMAELNAEYPEATILREDCFIDITVRTADELVLFEIKSDLDPKSVIRQALGQILEYAYHPSRDHNLPVRLVIVGRKSLSARDGKYLDVLKRDFKLPIEYRAVSI